MLGAFGQQSLDQGAGQIVRGGQLALADAGFAVDAQAQAEFAVGDGEQRLGLARQGAAREGDAEGAGAGIGAFRDPYDLVQRGAFLGGGAAVLNTTKPPAMPRRRARSPAGAEAMSSVTAKHRAGMPPAVSHWAARPKFITSPA